MAVSSSERYLGQWRSSILFRAWVCALAAEDEQHSPSVTHGSRVAIAGAVLIAWEVPGRLPLPGHRTSFEVVISPAPPFQQRPDYSEWIEKTAGEVRVSYPDRCRSPAVSFLRRLPSDAGLATLRQLVRKLPCLIKLGTLGRQLGERSFDVAPYAAKSD